MERAIALAKLSAENNEVPVGALIADKKGNVIVEAQNRMRRDNNPMAHAEMLAIQAFNEKHGTTTFATNYRIFVSLEPCPMCAHAIALMRFDALYYAAYDVKAGGVDNGARIFAQKGCNHIPEIISGLCEQESTDLLQAFFRAKRG